MLTFSINHDPETSIISSLEGFLQVICPSVFWRNKNKVLSFVLNSIFFYLVVPKTAYSR